MVGGGGRGLQTSKVDISERMSRTSRAAWRFVFGSVMLDWGIAVAVWNTHISGSCFEASTPYCNCGITYISYPYRYSLRV